MPNKEIDIVVVNILGREFKIKCPKDKVTELQKAAKYLNEKMQEVQHGDRFITIDRVAITTALNIAHDLIIEKQSKKSHSNDLHLLNDRLLDLQQRIDQAIISVD